MQRVQQDLLEATSDERGGDHSLPTENIGLLRFAHNQENNGTPSVTVRSVVTISQAMRAALADRQQRWNSRGVSSLLTVWRLPIAFRGVEDKLKCSYHKSQIKGSHRNRDFAYTLPTLNTSFCLAAYIGRTYLPK